MEWLFIKPLRDEKLIDQFEQKVGYRFPLVFRECVMKNNGGNVEPDCFDTQKEEGKVFNRLFSFDPADRGSMWVMAFPADEEEAVAMKNYVPFADSPNGDAICFDRRDDSIVYVDHETLDVEYVAPSFQAFLDKLYSDEDE